MGEKSDIWGLCQSGEQGSLQRRVVLWAARVGSEREAWAAGVGSERDPRLGLSGRKRGGVTGAGAPEI